MNKIKCPELSENMNIKRVMRIFYSLSDYSTCNFFMFQQNMSQFAQSLPQIGIYVNKQADHKGWDKSDILLIFSKILPAKS